MASVIRAALYAGCLAWGSWLGLGKPSVEDGRALVEKAKASADAKASANAEAKANANADAKAKADANAEGKATPDGGDVPSQTDSRGIPSMRMWPELNAEASIPKAWMVAEGPVYRPGNGRRLVTLTFDDVFRAHNEHRLLFSAIVTVANAHLAGWSLVGEMYLGIALSFVAYLMLVAIGPNAKEVLTKAVTSKPADVGVLQLKVSLARIVPIMGDNAAELSNAKKVAEKVFGKGGSKADEIRLSVDGGDSLKIKLLAKGKAIQFLVELGLSQKDN